jgi:hypothetical protein
VNLYIAVVQAEGELIHIPANMLWTGVVVDPVQAALQDRPDALYRQILHVGPFGHKIDSR